MLVYQGERDMAENDCTLKFLILNNTASQKVSDHISGPAQCYVIQSILPSYLIRCEFPEDREFVTLCVLFGTSNVLFISFDQPLVHSICKIFFSSWLVKVTVVKNKTEDLEISELMLDSLCE